MGDKNYKSIEYLQKRITEILLTFVEESLSDEDQEKEKLIFNMGKYSAYKEIEEKFSEKENNKSCGLCNGKRKVMVQKGMSEFQIDCYCSSREYPFYSDLYSYLWKNDMKLCSESMQLA